MKIPPDFIPFHTPSIGAREIEAVTRALEDGWISSGPRVARFEEAFAEAVGSPLAVAVNSCTAALHLALEAAGIGEGDEVIVPDMTFAATAEAVLYQRGRPVLADCDRHTLQLDPAAAYDALTQRTKAVIPVHYAGQACDMDPILELAERSGLSVIEDCAHAFPAYYRDSHAGTMGQSGAFSFYATKTLACGEGGMLVTADERIADRARAMRLHGITVGGSARERKEGTWNYTIDAAGFKYNMPELQAALGLAQLERSGEMLERRQRIARLYTEGLASVSAVELPCELPGRSHAWHLFVLRLRLRRLRIDRDRFIELLRRRGVGTSVHWVPLHRHSFYRNRFGLAAEDFPRTEAAFQRIISLPIWPDMSDEQVRRVIEAVGEVAGSNAA